MSIELARIDDKLIHAQIVWGWVPIIKPSQLIVVNDEAAKDDLRRKILLIAAEPILDHVEVKILSLEEASKDTTLRKNLEGIIILVLSKPADIVFLIKRGINIKKVSLGYMSHHPGKKMVLGTVSMDDEDIKAFKELILMGVDLEYQASPLDKPISAKDWMMEEAKS